MRCDAVQRQFDALEFDALSASETTRLRHHLTACPACAAALDARQAEDVELKAALAAEVPPLGMWSAVEAAIIASPAPLRRAAPRSLHRGLRWAVGVATATALLFAAGRWSVRPPRTPVTPPSRSIASSPAAPASSETVAAYVMGAWRDPLADQVALGARAWAHRTSETSLPAAESTTGGG